MAKYRIIKSGQNERREYLPLNQSPLFKDLPQVDIAQEQKKSYFIFLYEKLPQLLKSYFPTEFNDHNNNIKINIKNINIQEPEETEKEAQVKSST